MAKLPTGITKRGEQFRVQVMWQGTRKTGSCDTLDEAIALRSRLDADLKTAALRASEAVPGTAEVGGRWTLGHARDRCAGSKWAGSKSEHTALVNSQAAVDYFRATCAIDKITTDTLDGYVAHLVKLGNADGTINRKLAALRTILAFAVDRDKLTKVPKFPRRKEFAGRIRFLTDAEETGVLNLLNQWDKMDEADGVAVLVDTGVRYGELLRIDGTKDIDHKHRAVHIWETKGDLPRTVPLTTRAYGIIQRRAIMHKGILFPYGADWLRHPWDHARALLGLSTDDQFVIHALRHTFASRLVQRGVPIQVVQKLLGHKDIKMTMRYAHLCPANLAAAVALLEPQKVDA